MTFSLHRQQFFNVFSSWIERETFVESIKYCGGKASKESYDNKVNSAQRLVIFMNGDFSMKVFISVSIPPPSHLVYIIILAGKRPKSFNEVMSFAESSWRHHKRHGKRMKTTSLLFMTIQVEHHNKQRARVLHRFLQVYYVTCELCFFTSLSLSKRAKSSLRAFWIKKFIFWTRNGTKRTSTLQKIICKNIKGQTYSVRRTNESESKLR